MRNTVTISIEEYDNLRECKKFVDSAESVYLLYEGIYKVRSLDEIITQLKETINGLEYANRELNYKNDRLISEHRKLIRAVTEHNELPWYERIFNKIVV